jgi:ribosome biogenesis GTPase
MQQLSAQLSFDDLSLIYDEELLVFRITAIHRDRIEAVGIIEEQQVTIDLLCPAEFRPTSQFLAVGDWLVAEPAEEHWRIQKVLAANTQLQRISADKPQLIAANLDYLWIVTSANQDFNLKRLQRYLALALDAGIEPVVILTKSDLCTEDELDGYKQQLKQLNAQLIHAISVITGDGLAELETYLQSGNSIALVGSSGVGKSSLLNTLAHESSQSELQAMEMQATGVQKVAGIREDDAKGKHTTTARQLFFLPAKDEGPGSENGQVAIIDTPGMRELQLLNSQQGIEETFADIHQLAQSCRFADCQHELEPGCKVQQALANGVITQDDFDNYQKLLREDQYAKRRESGTFAEREHQRAFTKMVNTVMKHKNK